VTDETSPFCPDCGGTGLDDWEQECASCEGTGAPDPPPARDSGSIKLADGGTGAIVFSTIQQQPANLEMSVEDGAAIYLKGDVKLNDNDETLQETLQRQEGEIAFLKGMLMKIAGT